MTVNMRISRLGRTALVLAIAGIAMTGSRIAADGDGTGAVSSPRATHHPMRPQREENGRIMRSTSHQAETDNWSGYFVARYQTSQSYTAVQGR